MGVEDFKRIKKGIFLLKSDFDDSVTSLKHLNRRNNETVESYFKPKNMDFKKKPFKLIPLHKAMNIEKTMRGKFVNKFSTNLNFKNANPFVNSKSEKTNINLLNPLKDFIDEISFDLNIAGNSSYGNVNINQKQPKNNYVNSNDSNNNDGRITLSSNKNNLFLTKNDKDHSEFNYRRDFDLPRILPILNKQDYDSNVNQVNYSEEETSMINKILADKLTNVKINDYNNNRSNSNVMRIDKYPEPRNKNLYSKKKRNDKVTMFPFSQNLNKELARVSNIFGRESSMKYFAPNPKTEYYFERSPNVKIYKNFKVLADKNIIKPKLLPLKIYRETSYEKLSGSFFDLHKNINKKKVI